MIEATGSVSEVGHHWKPPQRSHSGEPCANIFYTARIFQKRRGMSFLRIWSGENSARVHNTLRLFQRG